MADGVEVARAYVTIIPKTDGSSNKVIGSIASEAGKAGDDAGAKMGKGVTGALAKTKGAGAAAGQSLGGALKGGFGKAVAGMGALVAGIGIKSFVKGCEDSFTSLQASTNSLKRIIGGTTEEVSGLMGAMRLSGMDVGKANASLTIFSKNISKLKAGSDELSKAESQLGTSIRGSDGSMRSMNELLPEIAETFKNMPDGANKTALACRYFGKSGTEMLPFLNKGKEGVGQLAEKAKELGIVLDDSSGAKFAAYKGAVREFETAMEGAKVQLGQAFLPYATQVAGFLSATLAPAFRTAAGLVSDFLNGFSEGLDTEGFQTAFQGVADAVGAAFGEGGEAASAKDFGGALANGLNGAIPVIEAVTPAVGGVASAVKFLADNAGVAVPAIAAVGAAFGAWKAVQAVSGAISLVSGLLPAMGAGGAAAAGGLAATAGGEAAAGAAATASAAQMLAFGGAVLMVGAGVALAGAGLWLMANAAVSLSQAGAGAVGVMAGMVAALAGLALGAAAVGPALAVAAPGLLAFGAAVALAGAGALAAGAGMALLAASLPAMAACAPMAAAGLAMMAPAMLAMAAPAIALALPMAALGAAMAVLGPSALLGGAGMALMASALPSVAASAPAAAAGIAQLGAAAGASALGLAASAPGMAALAAAMALAGASALAAAAGTAMAAAALPAVASSAQPASAGLAALAAAAALAAPQLSAAAEPVRAMASGAGGMAAQLSAAAASMASVAAASRTAFSSVPRSAASSAAAAVAAVRAGMAQAASAVASAKLKMRRIEVGPLPHFRFEGEFDAKAKRVPSLSVNWYDSGGIFASPAVIGVGERRPEVVAPLEELPGLLGAGAGGPGVTVNLNYSDDARAVQMARDLGRLMRRRGLMEG